MDEVQLELKCQHPLASFVLDVDLALPLKGVTAIWGESGSGKTSLLNLIAGFSPPKSGKVQVGEHVWADTEQRLFVPPHKRPVGFLFQEPRLFPHLTVEKNILYADQRSSASDQKLSLGQIINAFNIEHLLNRHPASLSGGEQQRVALSRTLLTRPDLLLLDEPLSALDTVRKTEFLPFIEKVANELGIPMIYVSHDIDEVSRLADRVVVLKQGRVEAYDSTRAIMNSYGLEAGRNPYDIHSILEATIEDGSSDPNFMSARIGGNRVWLPKAPDAQKGNAVRLAVAARDVSISLSRPEGISIQNILAGEILSIDGSRDPTFVYLKINIEGQSISSCVTARAMTSLDLSVGQTVFALVKTASLHRS